MPDLIPAPPTCAATPNPIRLRLTALVAFMLISACMTKSSPPQPVYYYTLDYDEPQLVTTTSPLPYVVRVERFSASPPFQSRRIIYADKGLHRNAYAYHQWVAPPGELLAFFIARDLDRVNAFRGVGPPDASMVATHTVNGWVKEFLEKDGPDGWQAILRLNITLINADEHDPSRRVLFQKGYAATAPCEEKTPAALAHAMSEAASAASEDIVRDIYDYLAALKPPE